MSLDDLPEVRDSDAVNLLMGRSFTVIERARFRCSRDESLREFYVLGIKKDIIYYTDFSGIIVKTPEYVLVGSGIPLFQVSRNAIKDYETIEGYNPPLQVSSKVET